MRDRTRGWCATLNNYTTQDIEMLENYMNENCTYGVIGKEIGESGTPHLQIHMEFKYEKSLNVLKKINSRMHFEQRKGSIKQASDYCKEDGDYIEIGKLKTRQGKRTDLSAIRDAVNEGKNMREICDIANSYQSIKYAETLRKYKMAVRNWEPEVYWYWGPTGTGKTRLAMDESDVNDRWVSMDSLRWWDGYDGQGDIIVDDFRGGDCRLKTLLRILDRYEFRVENKGSSTQLLAKRIWITCPYSPEMSYRRENTDEDMKQLIRRITKIIQFDNSTYMELTLDKYDNPKTGYVGCDTECSDDEFWDDDFEIEP